MADALQQFRQIVRSAIEGGSLRRIVISRAVDSSDSAVQKITIRPVEVRGEVVYQWTRRIGTQERHDNLSGPATQQALDEAAGTAFRHVTLFTADASWSARFTRRGRCLLNRESVANDESSAVSSSEVPSHNRARQYLIAEGRPVPFLVETGIMTTDGRVRSRFVRKFRQINRYIEFIADVVERLPSDETIRIVDFGCGKSYLTFATQYYLTQLAGRSVHITGLERRADVVESCRAMVQRLGLTDVHFEQTDIADFDPADDRVHLTVSLHACDTATDDALFQAVRWSADVILAVPCCQHELAGQIGKESIPVIRRHGILNERFCALATDAVRASVLERVGYQTQVVEFIDMEHTAKNVLIRAIRRRHDAADRRTNELADQQQQFSEVFALPVLSLERKLRDAGLLS